MSQEQDTAMRSKDICRCHVYRYVHDEGRCDHPFRRARGLRLWLMDHDPILHLTGWVWLNLWDDRRRMNAATRFHARHPEICFCDLVTAVLLDGAKDDYRGRWGCGCTVPRFRPTRLPTGDCYCSYINPTTGGEK